MDVSASPRLMRRPESSPEGSKRYKHRLMNTREIGSKSSASLGTRHAPGACDPIGQVPRATPPTGGPPGHASPWRIGLKKECEKQDAPRAAFDPIETSRATPGSSPTRKQPFLRILQVLEEQRDALALYSHETGTAKEPRLGSDTSSRSAPSILPSETSVKITTESKAQVATVSRPSAAPSPPHGVKLDTAWSTEVGHGARHSPTPPSTIPLKHASPPSRIRFKAHRHWASPQSASPPDGPPLGLADPVEADVSPPSRVGAQATPAAEAIIVKPSVMKATAAPPTRSQLPVRLMVSSVDHLPSKSGHGCSSKNGRHPNRAIHDGDVGDTNGTGYDSVGSREAAEECSEESAKPGEPHHVPVQATRESHGRSFRERENDALLARHLAEARRTPATEHSPQTQGFSLWKRKKMKQPSNLALASQVDHGTRTGAERVDGTQAHAAQQRTDEEARPEPEECQRPAPDQRAWTLDSSATPQVDPSSRPPVPQEDRTSGPDQSDTQKFHWRKGELLGQGSFGQVYLGLNLSSGELMAVKQITLVGCDGSESLEDAEELTREIRVMKELHHENIVRYIGASINQTSHELNVFLEYVPGGSVARMLSQFGAFPEDIVRTYTRQILCGVAYLHSKSILHRDIKGANVLVDQQGRAKLGDFGCSKQMQSMWNSMSSELSIASTPGSVPWMAPEVVKAKGFVRSSDIWSVGATVIEMITTRHPWPSASNQMTAVFMIAATKGPPVIPPRLSPVAQDFLSQSLRVDPKGRPSAESLLAHPFLRA